MFNPFRFFRKKPTEQPELGELTVKPAVAKPINIDNIVVHTMPERFRLQPAEVKNSKTTGILIISGGVVFLIIASVFLYFYLFRTSDVTVKEEPSATDLIPESEIQEAAPEVNQPPVDSATTTETIVEPEVLPDDNSLETTAADTPEIIEPELAIGLIPSLDSDNDGLTDAEEILLGTGTSTPDTDGDTYLDGAELQNLYNPASTTKLIANANIAAYENKTFNYSILYPTSWQSSVNGGDDSIMFKSLDNQFFQVIVQSNIAKQTLEEWYLEQLAVPAVNDADWLSGAGWQGIKNLDGLTVYLMDSKQNYIFTLAYNPGENNILDYINIFNMMIKSFNLK